MDPDPDWYLDNVVVAGGPENAPVGAVRQRQAAWLSKAHAVRAVHHELVPAIALALRQGLVLTRNDLRAVGVPPPTTRRLVRRGTWTVPRRGVVCPLPAAATGPSGAGPEIAASAAALVWPGTLMAFASAAAVHGLPLLSPPGPPALTADHYRRALSREDVRLHISALVSEDEDHWFGAPITSIARTVVDLSRERGVADGLVAADAALHEQLVTPTELERAVLRQRGWPGVRSARRAVELADGRAESPLESLARLCFMTGGLPPPQLQTWIETDGGWYRVDFLWPERRVVVEADGLVKYRNDWRALVEEKRRQEYLERAGYRVIRLLWDDVVHDAAATIARVRLALG